MGLKENMFYGATKYIFASARILRKKPTLAEKLLWDFLKSKPGGFKFRRQHPIGMYVADFYCHALKLVIEVDGSVHENAEAKFHDKMRQKVIEEDSIRVIRFKNHDIENHFSDVVSVIEKVIEEESRK